MAAARDPAQYPSASVATSGTDDTETLAETLMAAGPDVGSFRFRTSSGGATASTVRRPSASQNRTWRLPGPVEDLPAAPESRQRAEFLRRTCARFGRRRRRSAVGCAIWQRS